MGAHTNISNIRHETNSCPIRVQASVVGVCLEQDEPLVGIALQGPSNIGKSSLALALIETCIWQRTALVSDDITQIILSEGTSNTVLAKAIEPTQGLVEIRGYGPASTRHCEAVNIQLALTLTPQPQARMPVLQDWQFENAIRKDAGHRSTIKILTHVAHLPYCVEKLTWCDHAIRIRAILRSVFAGQTP